MSSLFTSRIIRKFILLGPVLLLGGFIWYKRSIVGCCSLYSLFLISAKISSKLIGYQINNCRKIYYHSFSYLLLCI